MLRFTLTLLFLILSTAQVFAGSISGIITESETGNPVSEAGIAIYHYDGTAWTKYRNTTANTNGSYTIDNLSDDDYAIAVFADEFLENALLLEPEFYGGTKLSELLDNMISTVETLPVISINDNSTDSDIFSSDLDQYFSSQDNPPVTLINVSNNQDVTSINVQLDKFQTISGSAIDSNGDILSNLDLIFYWKVGDTWIEYPPIKTDNAGNYTFRGIASFEEVTFTEDDPNSNPIELPSLLFAGTYRLKVIDKSKGINTFYDSESDLASSSDIDLVASAKILNICLGCPPSTNPEAVPTLNNWSLALLMMLLLSILIVKPFAHKK